jgi:hypothetical protein
MQRFDKYTVQTLGFALIVIGIFLFILGIAGPYGYSGPPPHTPVVSQVCCHGTGGFPAPPFSLVSVLQSHG